MALADKKVLYRYNNTCGLLPDYYLDRAFTCRDCGAEEVWTAKQQKWWYEVVHAPIKSEAIRCLACRRARRAQSMVHEGANLLREQTRHLRVLGTQPPTAEALAEIEAALQSKWWGLHTVAIQTLGRWGGPKQIAQLEAILAAGFKKYEPHMLEDGSVFVCPPGDKSGTMKYQAARAAGKVLHELYRDRLRALGDKPPTAEALAEVQAALKSRRWWDLPGVAIQTLGRWGGPEQIAQLRGLVAAGSRCKCELRVYDCDPPVVAGFAKCKSWSWKCDAAAIAAKALRELNAP
jgi:hypothetical protein